MNTRIAEIKNHIEASHHYGSVALVSSVPGIGVFADTRKALTEITEGEPTVIIDTFGGVPANATSLLVDVSYLSLNTQSGIDELKNLLVESDVPTVVFAPVGYKMPNDIADFLTESDKNYTE